MGPIARCSGTGRDPGAIGTPLGPPCCGPGPGGRGGSPRLRLHLGSPWRRDRRLPALPVPTGRRGQTHPIRPDPHDGSTSGGLYRVRQPTHLAQSAGDERRRDRLDLARRHGTAVRDQCRGQVPPVHLCASNSWRSPGSTSRPTRATRSPVAPSQGLGAALRGRAQKLVGIMGSRRRRPPARLRHVLRRGGGMADLSHASP